MGVKKIIKFDDIKISTDNMTAEVDLKKLANRYNKAQYELDSAIMESMKRFMPAVMARLLPERKQSRLHWPEQEKLLQQRRRLVAFSMKGR